MSEGKEFEILASGAYPARLYQIIHMGVIDSGQYGPKDTVRLAFEFPTEKTTFKEENGEQPFVLSQEYTLSTHEKSNLRKVIHALIGAELTDQEAESFDVEDLIGKECLVTVVHNEGKNGKIYANIGNTTVLPKGMECPAPINEAFVLNYREKWDDIKFATLPDFIKSKMQATEQFKFKGEEVQPDDIPF